MALLPQGTAANPDSPFWVTTGWSLLVWWFVGLISKCACACLVLVNFLEQYEYSTPLKIN